MHGHGPERIVMWAKPRRQGSVASWAGTPVGTVVCAGTEESQWSLEGTLDVEEGSHFRSARDPALGS